MQDLQAQQDAAGLKRTNAAMEAFFSLTCDTQGERVLEGRKEITQCKSHFGRIDPSEAYDIASRQGHKSDDDVRNFVMGLLRRQAALQGWTFDGERDTCAQCNGSSQGIIPMRTLKRTPR